jgi:hypothetical protein
MVCPILEKHFHLRWEPEKLSGIVLGSRLDHCGFKSRQQLGIFLFTTMSRLDLRPTLPPIHWVTGTLSLRIKQLGHEAKLTTHLHQVLG